MAAGDFFVRRWEALKNKQIWGRIGQIVLVLLGISFVTFALVMLSPGDPVRQMIAGNEDIVVSQVEIDALRHELGLDKPFIFQYLDWLGRAVQGDFGFSYMVKKPVVEELMQSLPATLILALASTLFMLVFSLPLGIYSAVKRNSVFDYAVRGLTFFGVSIPNFWMGLMLLWIFGLKLGWAANCQWQSKSGDSDFASYDVGYSYGSQIYTSGKDDGFGRTQSGLRCRC